MIVIDNVNTSLDTGVWTNFGGSSFLVASSGNAKFQRVLNRLQAPHRRKIEKGSLDPVEGKEILCRALAEGVLLDWKNVKTSKGGVVEYTVELGFQALKNNDDLRDFIQEFSMERENFNVEEIEEEGNS